MKIEYHKVGDYYYPNLTIKQAKVSLSKYGRMRMQYLKQHQIELYFKLLANGELYSHIKEVDKQANDLYDKLLVDFKNKRNITEALKERNQILWVQEMNDIHNCIDEVICCDIIYL
ncbi:MAG: TnpV protein [Erysipelotrichaceae bacterium]